MSYVYHRAKSFFKRTFNVTWKYFPHLAFVVIGSFFLYNNSDLISHSYFVENNKAQLEYRPAQKIDSNIVACRVVLVDSNVIVSPPPKVDSDVIVKVNTIGSMQEEFPYNLLSKIIDTTGNTITYFSAIIGIITLLTAIALFKYYRKYLTLENRIDELSTSVLDSALTTLYAVRFVEATQITSSDYLEVMRHIAELVRDNKKDVERKPKYAPLLLCQALQLYFEKRYEDAIEIMKTAERLTNDRHFKQDISFHLARTYKQLAYYELGHCINSGINDRQKDIIENYLREARKYVNFSAPKLRKSLNISILSIESLLFKQLGRCSDIMVQLSERISDIVMKEAEDRKNYSFNRMTVVPMWIEQNENSIKDVHRRAGDDFIKYMNTRLQGQSGKNILASWYFSMARVSIILGVTCTDRNQRDMRIRYLEEGRMYLNLAQSYYDDIKNNSGVSTLFVYDCLAEIDKKGFEKKLKEWLLWGNN